MEYYGKEKKIYQAIWIPFLGLLTFPGACFTIFYLCVGYYLDYPTYIDIDIALFFAGMIGVLFCVICILTGFIGDVFSSLIDRIKETREFFPKFDKEARKWYFYRFKRDGGFILWGFILILLLYISCTLCGFFSFFSWYLKANLDVSMRFLLQCVFMYV